jgi:hypothetical protein
MKLSGFLSDYTQQKGPAASSGLFRFDGMIVDRSNTKEQMAKLIHTNSIRKEKGKQRFNSLLPTTASSVKQCNREE